MNAAERAMKCRCGHRQGDHGNEIDETLCVPGGAAGAMAGRRCACEGFTAAEGEPLTHRQRIAAAANEVGRLSRYGGAPVLTADSARGEVVAWLQWCDPNGIHTDDLAAAEDCDPYDLDGAWLALADMISDEL
jgi:hypothetical protein